MVAFFTTCLLKKISNFVCLFNEYKVENMADHPVHLMIDAPKDKKNRHKDVWTGDLYSLYYKIPAHNLFFTEDYVTVSPWDIINDIKANLPAAKLHYSKEHNTIVFTVPPKSAFFIPIKLEKDFEICKDTEYMEHSRFEKINQVMGSFIKPLPLRFYQLASFQHSYIKENILTPLKTEESLLKYPDNNWFFMEKETRTDLPPELQDHHRTSFFVMEGRCERVSKINVSKDIMHVFTKVTGRTRSKLKFRIMHISDPVFTNQNPGTPHKLLPHIIKKW